MCGIADAVIGYTTLWEVVGADLSRTVAGRNQTLTTVSDIIHVLLVLLIINKGVQTRECALLVLRLVAGLGTLNQDLLGLTSVRVLPHVTQAYTRFNLVHVLTTGTTRTEGIPLDLTLVHVYLKLVGLGQHGYGGSTGLHTSVALGHWHTLYAVYTTLVLQCTVNVGTCYREVNLLESAYGTLRYVGNRHLPALRLAVVLVHLKQVASKQGSLVATCSCTYLHFYVLGIFGVFRYQRNLNFLLQLWL